MISAETIAGNVAAVEARIAGACQRAGRRREDVTLIAVSKTFPAIAVDAAVAAGVQHVGENRVQEARAKIPEVKTRPTWHLVGRLQSNKAKEAVELFDVIGSVDSFNLAEQIGKYASARRKPQDILLQVNIGREPQKGGVDPSDVHDLADRARRIEAIRLRGLMAIPPVGSTEDTRRWFREMRTLRDGLGLEHLSIGMSDDFELAIEEGSTMIRVGRAIFGARGKAMTPAGREG
ncbi:MAG TPA: YggS family pyridoxal phosphate-dependent enzyme [Thermoanaerobaculia bacterium]|nr:YggS family pyridoxal phosphate-dependent enzyme [Thermoanaerobaculia bacterium]